MRHRPVVDVFLVVFVVVVNGDDTRERKRYERPARMRETGRVTFHTRTRFPISGISLTTRRARCVTIDPLHACHRDSRYVRAREHLLLHGDAGLYFLGARACADRRSRGRSPPCRSPLRQVVHWEAYPPPRSFSVAARNRAGRSAATHSLRSLRPSVRSFVRWPVRTSVRDGTQTRSDEAARGAHTATRDSPGAPEAARVRAHSFPLVFTRLSLSLFSSILPRSHVPLHAECMYRDIRGCFPLRHSGDHVTRRSARSCGARSRVAESDPAVPWARSPRATSVPSSIAGLYRGFTRIPSRRPAMIRQRPVSRVRHGIRIATENPPVCSL